MKKAELKELIKNSILEGEYLEDDSKAMNAMDAAMVQDYEDEEANKFALDSEEPMEEVDGSSYKPTADFLDKAERYGYGGVNELEPGTILQGADYRMKVVSRDGDYYHLAVLGKEHLKPMRMHHDSLRGFPIYSKPDVVAEADAIVEAWTSKKKLTEQMHGGYIELMEMNPKFDKGLEMLLEVWNEWKSGTMTEPEMIGEAREDLLSYLASILK
jgi:hypothetical protein